MREKQDLSAREYASERGRESNRLLAFSWCCDELGQFELGMEDDAINLIGHRRNWETYN